MLENTGIVPETFEKIAENLALQCSLKMQDYIVCFFEAITDCGIVLKNNTFMIRDQVSHV